MYIEASSPRKAGEKARLQSVRISDNQARCVNFWWVLDTGLNHHELEIIRLN